MNDRLQRARCRLLITNPWYGTFCSMMRWREAPSLTATMGVRMLRDGTVDCAYNAAFLNELTDRELTATIQHEVGHVVRLHCTRRTGRNPQIWNLAADAIVNGRHDNPNILHLPEGVVHYYEAAKPNLTTEALYDWLLKNAAAIPGGGELLDDHDFWESSQLPADQAREIVKSMAERASTLAGTTPGELTEAIEELKIGRTDYRRLLREYLGKECGGSRVCWSRPNRRLQQFGVPGQTSLATVDVNVFVDTSGSVTKEMLSEFFGIVEQFLWHGRKVRLIEFDHGIRHVSKYRRNDWRKIEIHGRGGTSFVETLKQAEDRNLISNVNVVLTDGEAEFPDQKPYSVIWVIAGGDVKPPWGKTVKVA